jgi:hypothetical protein
MRRPRLTSRRSNRDICAELNAEEQPHGKAMRWTLMRWRELLFWLGVASVLYLLSYAIPVH